MEFENGIKFTTNNRPGSVKVVTIKRVTFDELWEAYPDEKIEHIDPETNEDIFDNKCAINLSETLYRNDIKLKSFKGVKCWHTCPTAPKGKNIHAIRAQELADWLKLQPFPGCPKPELYTGETYEKNVDNRTGIIFFKDYWQRSNEKESERRTGDHIDLWDGRGANKLASQNDISNFFTNTMGLYWDGLYSNKGISKEVLFWEIK